MMLLIASRVKFASILGVNEIRSTTNQTNWTNATIISSPIAYSPLFIAHRLFFYLLGIR
jgi:hypothetical protein